MGKKIKLDSAKVETLASYDCTMEEIASGLGVSTDTLDRRRKEEPGIAEAIVRGRARIRISLRKAQLKSAIKDGNPQMLKWMGTQMLGQSDASKHEHSGPDGGPIQVNDLSNLNNEELEERLTILDKYIAENTPDSD